jgi:hypothetical protein
VCRIAQFDVACGRKNECECSRGDSAGDLECDTEITSNECNFQLGSARVKPLKIFLKKDVRSMDAKRMVVVKKTCRVMWKGS